ncbi:hypothetical protein SH2C18_09790 [Clostridium sediminicola]|uniref:sensor histidine kinase n=1 Tax=Clostridium sediminicola TaxID=3114879 RepID=UPI0031F210DE
MENKIPIYHLITCSIEAMNILLIFSLLIEKKFNNSKDKIKFLLYIIIYTLYSVWITLNLPLGYRTILIVIFSFISISILFSIKLYASIIIILCSSIYFMFNEFLVLSVLSLILHMGIMEIVNSLSYGFYISLFIQSVEIFELVVMFKFRNRFRSFNTIFTDNNTTAYKVLGIFFIIVSIMSLQSSFEANSTFFLSNVLLYLMFGGFITVNILDYKKRVNLLNIKYKYELREEYIDNLETVVDIVRKEKHDFANIINTVYALCVLDRKDSLQKIRCYLKKTIDNLDDSYRFYDTGNQYIDGLLAVKSKYAIDNNIYLDIDFEESLEFLDIDNNDLIAIISNILDNAIHAVNSSTKEENKIISFYSYIENDSFYISLSNNGPMIPKQYLNKIFQKGFSTKRKNRGDHGYGLFIVRDLVNRNKGSIDIISNENNTEFLLKFKVKKEYYERVC